MKAGSTEMSLGFGVALMIQAFGFASSLQCTGLNIC